MQNVNCLTRTGKIAEWSAKYVTAPDAKPRLLDQLREALRARHYSRRTESTDCLWGSASSSLTMSAMLD